MRSILSMSTLLRLSLAAALVLAPVAPAQEPAAPTPDAVIDALLQVKPEELVATMKSLKEQAAAQATEAAVLKAQADEQDARATAMQSQLDTVMTQLKALSEKLFPPPAPTQMAAAPAPEMAPAEMAAEAPKGPNFAEHVAPIFKQHCAKCHNEDTRKSGFAATTFNLVMEGGGSGKVIEPGDTDGSRLLRLIMRTEEPAMPPSGAMPEDQIEIVRQWIAAGALADAKSKPMAQAKADAPAAEEGAFVAATFADTPPMPEAPLAAVQPAGLRPAIARAMDTSPTAPLLAIGGKQQVLLVDTGQFEVMGALPFPEGDVFTLTFSVNGELLLVGGGREGDSGAAVIFNVRTGERMQEFTDFYDTVLAADISPDHRMVALGGPNRVVRVYNAQNGELVYRAEKHTDWVLAAKFTPDGEVLVSADRGGGMFLWQAANGRYVEELKGHNGAIQALAYTADSKYLASGGDDGTVQIWDTWTYKRVRQFKAHDTPVLNVDVGKDGTILTTSTDATAKLFNFDGKGVRTFSGLNDWGYQTCFDNTGATVLAGNWRGEIVVWNKENAEQVTTLITQPAAG